MKALKSLIPIAVVATILALPTLASAGSLGNDHSGGVHASTTRAQPVSVPKPAPKKK
jgi:hypothetical protein